MLDELIKSWQQTIITSRLPLQIKWFVAKQHAHPVKQLHQLMHELKGLDNNVEDITLDLEEAERDFQTTEDAIEKKRAALRIRRITDSIAAKAAERVFIVDLIKSDYTDELAKGPAALVEEESDIWVAHMAGRVRREILAQGGVSPGTFYEALQMDGEVKSSVLELALDSIPENAAEALRGPAPQLTHAQTSHR